LQSVSDDKKRVFIDIRERYIDIERIYNINEI